MYMYVKECLPCKVSNGGIACNRCKGIVSNVADSVCMYIVQRAYHIGKCKITNIGLNTKLDLFKNAQYTFFSSNLVYNLDFILTVN